MDRVLWKVVGPDGEELAFVVGRRWEVVPWSRCLTGFYREGRSGEVRPSTVAEFAARVGARRGQDSRTDFTSEHSGQ